MPLISLSGKWKDAQKPEEPGPGTYSIAATIGKAPSHTIRGRTKMKSIEMTPGPGAYENTLRDSKNIAYTMRGRIEHNIATTSPGPGDYAYEKADKIRASSPAYTMGIKHQRRHSIDIPGMFNL